MNMNCRLNIPYPAVSVKEKNKHYANILAPLYTGAYSELTAISTYGYQALICEEKDKRLSEIIECISVIEMKHFRILGKLINLLGNDPVLYIRPQRGRTQYWSSMFCDFTYDPKEFINHNIQAEKQAIIDYNNAFKQINDQRIRDIIDRIILDEEHHIKIFESLQN